MKKRFLMVFFLVCTTLLSLAQKTEIDLKPDFPIWPTVGVVILVLGFAFLMNWLKKESKPFQEKEKEVFLKRKPIRIMTREEKLLSLKVGDSLVFSAKGHYRLVENPLQTKKGIRFVLLPCDEDNPQQVVLLFKEEFFYDSSEEISDYKLIGSIVVA